MFSIDGKDCFLFFNKKKQETNPPSFLNIFIHTMFTNYKWLIHNNFCINYLLNAHLTC